MIKFRKYRNNKKWLIQKYLKDKLSTQEIADLINCDSWTVRAWLKAFNIPRRTYREATLQAYLLKPEIRKYICGENNPAKRPEVRKKISNTLKGIFSDPEMRKKTGTANCGAKNGRWRGGLSFEPYGLEFNNKLRTFVRKRDNYLCQKCRIKENGINHGCHHIDYDKKNNKPENLITLCKSCHTKTNGNREYWQNYFIFSMQLRQGIFLQGNK